MTIFALLLITKKKHLDVHSSKFIIRCILFWVDLPKCKIFQEHLNYRTGDYKKIERKGVRKYILGGARLDNINDTKYEGIKKFKLGFGSDIKEE